VTLTVVGRVETEVGTSPSEITVSPDFSLGRGGKASVSVQNRSNKPLRLGKPVDPPAGLTVSFDPVEIAPSASGEVLVEIGPDCLINSDAILHIPTSHADEALLVIPVHIRPTSGLQFVPQAIRLGVVTRQRIADSGGIPVRLIRQSVDQFDVVSVSPPAFLKHSATTQKDGEREFMFVLAADYSSLVLNGEIVIELMAKTTPEAARRSVRLRITVSGVLNEG
jgi:hypothetical protein